MPRISQITDDFAERFNFEPSRVAQIAKALRMDGDGLIRSGPRGVNAPDATPLEAARLLIAMMLRVKHHEAAEGVRLFGSFRPLSDANAAIDGKEVETFDEAFALLLEYCGQPTPGEINQYFERVEFSLTIHRDTSFAEIQMGHWADEEEDSERTFEHFETFRFLHPEFGPSLAADGELTPELRTAWRRYRTGFHEVPTLTKQDLIEIGQVLAGHTPPLQTTE